jgi:hypothetical protein
MDAAFACSAMSIASDLAADVQLWAPSLATLADDAFFGYPQ